MGERAAADGAAAVSVFGVGIGFGGGGEYLPYRNEELW